LAVKIRLSRVGATKHPSYRVVVIDSRRPRDGRALEIIGFYDPLTDPATVRIDTARVDAWVGKGAKPSDTVARLLKLAEARTEEAAGAAKSKAPAAPRAPKATKARKAAAKPAAASATPAAETPETAEAAAPAAEAPETAGAAAPAAEAPETPEAAEAATPAAEAGE
jgi:small subunit ribosomal protein S16